MKQKKRWMTSVIETSKQDTPALPWARGTRRAEMIARRKAPQPQRRSA